MSTTPGATHEGDGVPLDRESLRERRQREGAQFGGVKIGVAFFGWLTAVGMAVLLTALIGAIGAGLSLVADVKTVSDAADATDASTSQVGWAGVIVVLVAVALAYYSGGYVSGRMARFDGLRQGVAVFAWSVVIAILVAIAGAIAGTKYDVLGKLNAFPRIPSNLSDLTLQAVVLLVGVVLAALFGAMAGGLAGMHFHRKVDALSLQS